MIEPNLYYRGYKIRIYVEKAEPEEDENATLLSQHNDKLRPPRPKPAAKSNGTTPAPPVYMSLQVQPIGSSSTIYTPDTTPAPDSAEWSKRWRRNDRRQGRLNTELLEAIESHNVEEVERPNAHKRAVSSNLEINQLDTVMLKAIVNLDGEEI
ncbi:jg12915 [Pararge aegeria aegeria]|uniref:Jg12915 protein n=1 Tax=Pararge aegeria aegeria TaxID=348720 RepID=A0A8S4S1E7_9NEOP|nr:jg12915 [Pararge aegeria aegeria]